MLWETSKKLCVLVKQRSVEKVENLGEISPSPASPASPAFFSPHGEIDFSQWHE